MLSCLLFSVDEGKEEISEDFFGDVLGFSDCDKISAIELGSILTIFIGDDISGLNFSLRELRDFERGDEVLDDLDGEKDFRSCSKNGDGDRDLPLLLCDLLFGAGLRSFIIAISSGDKPINFFSGLARLTSTILFTANSSIPA